MRNRCIISILSLVLGALTLNSVTFAHGTEKHGKMVTADAQMKMLHAMMPMFSLAAAGLENALGKANVAVAVAEAEKITAAIPELKKSRPHKNIKQRKTFVEFAANLEGTVTATVALAKKGDFAGANAAFKKVEEACSACHVKFRD